MKKLIFVIFALLICTVSSDAYAVKKSPCKTQLKNKTNACRNTKTIARIKSCAKATAAYQKCLAK